MRGGKRFGQSNDYEQVIETIPQVMSSTEVNRLDQER